MKKPQKRIVIIAAEFNKGIMDSMVNAAVSEAKKNGAATQVVRVPGSYEVPLLADAHLKKKSVHAVVVLGYIERGETLHGEVMGHAVQTVLLQLSIRYGKPIGMGIIGPGATVEQAERRKVDYAQAAIRAALRLHDLLYNS